jgi:neutral ceramidase
MRRLALLCALSGLLCLPSIAAADADKLTAGAARADITPPVGTPMFAYTARSRVAGPDKNADPEVGLMQLFSDPDRGLYAKSFVPSTGVHMRLYSRAVVIEREGVPHALVQVDLGGIPFSMTQAVLARIQDLGIGEDQLLISATHTHSGTGPIWGVDNMGYGVLGGDLLDPRVFNLTADGIAASIRDAYEKREPAKVGIGTTTLTDASRNREFDVYQRNEGIPPAEDAAAQRADSIDPDLTVIRVDSRDGDPLAVWSNFAIHATSFGDSNYLFSGDNPGVTEQIVEREIGGDVVNVWTNGNEGDISPNGGAEWIGGEPAQYTKGGGYSEAYMAGKRVAEGVLEAWENAGTNLKQDLEISSVSGHLPFDGTEADGEPVGPIPVLGLGIVAEYTCSPVEGSAGPGQGMKQYLYGHPGVLPGSAPVSVWRIGDLGITSTPSEVSKTMGQRIRNAVQEASGGKVSRVVMAGLTNGYLSYTSTPEEYDACSYMGSFTLFGRRQGPRYRDYSVGLANTLFNGAAQPPSLAWPLEIDQGADVSLPSEQTPNAGTPVEQPAASVARLGRATFSWNGGDRATDAPRGRSFVTLERKAGDDWVAYDDDSTYADIFRRSAGNVWTETYQFGACDPLGSYRFVITGRADKGSGPEDYTLTSEPFELTATQLQIAGNRALYPDPGDGALYATPRLVLDGKGKLAGGGTVQADPSTGTFPVPDGKTIESVEDGCGNAS